MKIYTRTGDEGMTGLFGGPRVSKDDVRIEAYGTVDELNAAIGVSRACQPPQNIDSQLEQIQHELFSMGAELATPNPNDHGLSVLGSDHIERLEQWIDQHEAELPPLTHFILPSGVSAAAQLHMARSICRRAERRLVTMAGTGENVVSESLIVYLNRLSDLLFVLSRAVNRQAAAEEVQWTRPTSAG